MMDLKQASDVLKILKNELPACFKKGKDKLPLAHDVPKSVIRHYEGDSRFNQDVLKKAIELYVYGTKYLKNIMYADVRINLYGKPVSNVTQFDRDFAKDILGTRKKSKLNYKYLLNGHE